MCAKNYYIWLRHFKDKRKNVCWSRFFDHGVYAAEDGLLQNSSKMLLCNLCTIYGMVDKKLKGLMAYKLCDSIQQQRGTLLMYCSVCYIAC